MELLMDALSQEIIHLANVMRRMLADTSQVYTSLSLSELTLDGCIDDLTPQEADAIRRNM